MNTLSDLLLIHILDALSLTRNEWGALRRVSQKFRRLIDFSVHPEISDELQPIDPLWFQDNIIDAAPKARGVKRDRDDRVVSVPCRNWFTAFWMRARSIPTLEMVHCGVNPEDGEQDEDFECACEDHEAWLSEKVPLNVVRLNMSFARNNDVYLDLGYLENLTELTLGENVVTICGQGLGVTSLPPSLRRLTLIQAIIDFHALPKELEELRIKWFPVCGCLNIRASASGLSQEILDDHYGPVILDLLPNLRVLDLHETPIGEDGLNAGSLPLHSALEVVRLPTQSGYGFSADASEVVWPRQLRALRAVFEKPCVSGSHSGADLPDTLTDLDLMSSAWLVLGDLPPNLHRLKLQCIGGPQADFPISPALPGTLTHLNIDIPGFPLEFPATEPVVWFANLVDLKIRKCKLSGLDLRAAKSLRTLNVKVDKIVTSSGKIAIGAGVEVVSVIVRRLHCAMCDFRAAEQTLRRFYVVFDSLSCNEIWLPEVSSVRCRTSISVNFEDEPMDGNVQVCRAWMSPSE